MTQPDNNSSRNEKERVYVELERVKRKCYQLRKEIRIMHEKFDRSELSDLRSERDEYRKILSYIAWQIDQGNELDIPKTRFKIQLALECRGRAAHLRRRLVRRHKREARRTA